MAACEWCWSRASLLAATCGGSVVDHYTKLVVEQNDLGADAACPQVRSNPIRASKANTEADARLIAAAPALLEALERIERSEWRVCRDGHVEQHEIQTLQRIARTAIAQARGETA